MWQAAGYGWQYGMAAARYGYGMQTVWVWVWVWQVRVWVWQGMGMECSGLWWATWYGRQQGVVGADRTVFASADHHCLGEEVVGNIDISKSLGEKLDVRA